jgi:hypothetical protein
MHAVCWHEVDYLGVVVVARLGDSRPVRSAYQPPASSTFLSEQTSH